MAQKPQKKARELTSDEVVKKLFHPDVVEHAKRHVREADARSAKPADPSKSPSTHED
ncbi:MAG: hypothetical protein ACHQ01_05870 [Candidatus Limnocylindrales bacterium]